MVKINIYARAKAKRVMGLVGVKSLKYRNEGRIKKTRLELSFDHEKRCAICNIYNLILPLCKDDETKRSKLRVSNLLFISDIPDVYKVMIENFLTIIILLSG